MLKKRNQRKKNKPKIGPRPLPVRTARGARRLRGLRGLRGARGAEGEEIDFRQITRREVE